MTIAQILNLVACGLRDTVGFGLKFCRFNFKQPAVMVLIPKEYKFLPADEFNFASIQLLQQKGIVRILKGVIDFVDSTPENERITRTSTGKMTTSLKHPYLMTFTFDNGLAWFKAIQAIDSNEAYDIMIFDVKGNLLMAKDRQGNGRGLDLGMLETGKYLIGNENSETITLQIDRENFDTSVAWIDSANLDFNATQDLDDYNNVDITMIAPANAATAISFSIFVGDSPKKVPLEGLAITDLRLQKTHLGTTTNVTATLASGTNPGDYVLTVPAVATGDTYSLSTYDSTVPSMIINLDGPLFKSPLATTVVV